MGWSDGDPHDAAGCLTAVLVDAAIVLALIVLVLLFMK